MSKEDSAATGSRLDARVLTHRVGSAIVQRAVFSGRRTAGCPSGQRERSVKPSAQPTLVRTQHLPPGKTRGHLVFATPWVGSKANGVNAVLAVDGGAASLALTCGDGFGGRIRALSAAVLNGVLGLCAEQNCVARSPCGGSSAYPVKRAP